MHARWASMFSMCRRRLQGGAITEGPYVPPTLERDLPGAHSSNCGSSRCDEKATRRTVEVQGCAQLPQRGRRDRAAGPEARDSEDSDLADVCRVYVDETGGTAPAKSHCPAQMRKSMPLSALRRAAHATTVNAAL